MLRAAAAWERAQPWESPALARGPRASAPPELLAAAAAGERVATIPGVEAWSLDAPVRAGEVFALDDGGGACAPCAPGARGRARWRSPSGSRR